MVPVLVVTIREKKKVPAATAAAAKVSKIRLCVFAILAGAASILECRDIGASLLRSMTAGASTWSMVGRGGVSCRVCLTPATKR
jgi:hypothetical protein